MDATFVVAFGITSSIISEYLSDRAPLSSGQLAWSSWLSWGILAAGSYIHKRLGSKYGPISQDVEAQSVRNSIKSEIYGVTLLALLIALAQFIANVVQDLLWWTLPLITISTYAAERLLSGNVKPPEQYDIKRYLDWDLYALRYCNKSLGLWPFAAFLVSINIVSSAALGLLPESGPTSLKLWVILFLALQTLVYVLLGRHHGHSYSESRLETPYSRTYPLFSLSVQTFAIWTLLVLSLYPRYFLLSPTGIVLGIVKACQMYAIVTLCTEGCTVPATTIATFAASFLATLGIDAYSSSSAMAIVALIALLQGVSSMSFSARYRYWLLLFSLLPMVAVLNRHKSSDMDTARLSIEAGWNGLHPIQRFVENGKIGFKNMLEGQSQTLDRAVKEYRRRYGRRPPPQFDKWFELAYSENYVLIDEFDSIMETLEPFWGMRPAIIRSLVKSSVNAAQIAHLTVRDNSVTVSSYHWLTTIIEGWLNKPDWLALLPDMELAINLLDEPRVVAPFDVIAEARKAAGSWHPSHSDSASDEDLTNETIVEWANAPGSSAWPAIEVACPSGSPALADDTVPRENTDATLHFINNLTESRDACTHADYKQIHGFLAAPETLRVTHSMTPIFSQGKPSMFQDVLYPSPYYTARMEDYVDADDHDWEEKHDNLYWTGASTGGHSRIDNWRNLHRQRLVLMTEADSTVPVTLLNETRLNVWQPYQTSWSNITRFFDVRIMAVGAQCDPDACTAMREHFGLRVIPDPNNDPQKDHLSASYGSKYVLDMDGNSFSGRFYRILGSRCAALKQTIIKEWHDGRLVPWVHFIPVSMEAEELGEIMRFLIEEKVGQEIGKQIAEDGRNWANTILRKIDLELTFLRILMEYGRVVSDDRDSLYYE